MSLQQKHWVILQLLMYKLVDGEYVGSASEVYNITSLGGDGSSFALCSSSSGMNSAMGDPYTDTTALDVKKEKADIGTKYYFAYENSEESDGTKSFTYMSTYSSFIRAEIPTTDFEETPNV